jgi:hypothetical protein
VLWCLTSDGLLALLLKHVGNDLRKGGAAECLVPARRQHLELPQRLVLPAFVNEFVRAYVCVGLVGLAWHTSRALFSVIPNKMGS